MNGNMSRDRNYQHLLNSKRWKTLRRWKLEQNPLCELCLREGKIVSAVDVHHIDPCENSQTLEEMTDKCFRVDNLQALCIPCHQRVHREARSHTRSSHEQRERERLERWKQELEARVAGINQTVVMDER